MLAKISSLEEVKKLTKHMPKHVHGKHVLRHKPVRHMLGHLLKHVPRHMLKYVPAQARAPEQAP